jgi:hypothetical protein
MVGELDVIALIAERLEQANILYMLTGSYALAHYTQPRMTRDLDFVIALGEDDIETMANIFSPDFYIERDDMRSAIQTQKMFNLMHFNSGVKVDFIIRKASEYRQVEFARRQKVKMNGVETWITTREDLILSKLLWSQDTHSELQQRDVKSLLSPDLDKVYLNTWGPRLKLEKTLEKLGV